MESLELSILQQEKLTGPNFTNWYRNLRFVLRSEGKLAHLEQPLILLPYPVSSQAAHDTYNTLYDAQNEVACLMLGSMSPELQRALKNYKAYDMIQELRTMFEEQAKQELFEIVKAFHTCYAMPNELGVSLILNSFNRDYDQFVQNYNMHNMGKTIAELHAMLKLHEKGILKKAETPDVLAIREGKIQKDKKKPRGTKGKDKGKNKLAYDPKPKILPPPKRDNPAKDSVCHHCKEVSHWRKNCPSYQVELKKRKNASVASNSGIFTIELYAFPNKTWVYDTSFGTHICNTLQGLRESRKLKHKALSLYMGNGMRAAVKAIRSFDLILPSGLIIVLENCHFAPSVTRGVVSISLLVNNVYIHTFTNYGVSVLKDNVFYFNAIPRDGIYEIDMHNLYPNVSSMFNVSNKRVKYSLDSSYLWHCRLGHINKKCMDKLQHDGILQPTHDESLKKCKSCISRKMARKPFPHQVERAKHLLGLIHTDVCGPFRTIPRELTPPYTPQHNGLSERRNQTLLDMVQSMMNLTTLPKSFWGYALESAPLILNMVPTKKVERTPYEIWHGKAPKMSYLRVWGYPKETMGYYFYYPLENKIFVARNAEFFENSLTVQEASGSHGLLESSGSDG
ncbi:zinc finger, CCHC-type containing protein [Tanacetum coccineum]